MSKIFSWSSLTQKLPWLKTSKQTKPNAQSADDSTSTAPEDPASFFDTTKMTSEPFETIIASELPDEPPIYLDDTQEKKEKAIQSRWHGVLTIYARVLSVIWMLKFILCVYVLIQLDVMKLYDGTQSASYAIALILIAIFAQIASGTLWLSYQWGVIPWYYALFVEFCSYWFVPDSVIGGIYILGFEAILLSIFMFMLYKVRQGHHSIV